MMQVRSAPEGRSKEQTFLDAVEKARQDCKTCQVAQPDLVTLGCAITNSGDPTNWEHRKVRQNRRLLGESWMTQGDGPIFIQQANGPTQSKPTPKYDKYQKTLFETPYDRTDNKIATGVMMNPYTGELLETFEDALPPPTTNKALDPSVFQKTNPKLVWLNGGIDPNAPLRSKKEICQDLPAPDGGPNVWGDQLYQGRRNARVKEIVNRDVWNNRNGIFACEQSLNGERPAGYEGLQPMYRALPYLPPTQILDNKNWKGPMALQQGDNMNREMVTGKVTTRRVDLSECARLGLPNMANGNPAVMVVPVIDPKPTWRGTTDSLYFGPGSVDKGQQSGYVVVDTEVKPTLKELMQEQYPVQNAGVPEAGGHVIQDLNVKPTLKELMQEQYPVQNAGVPDAGGHVIQDLDVKPTLKELMQEQYPVQNAGVPNAGGHVIQDLNIKPTLKELMQEQYPVQNAGVPEAGGHVIQDLDVKPTLKELMQEQYPVQNAGVPDAGGHVIQDLDVKPTLKELMQEQYPLQAASVPGTGDQLPFQGCLEGSRRMFYSDRPVTLAVGDTVGLGEYVGPGDVTSHQFRGTVATDYVVPSHVPADNGGSDASLRWVGASTRDTPSEFSPYTGVADFTQGDGTHMIVPRWRPLQKAPCARTDDLEDDFLSIRPNYFGHYPGTQ